MNAYQITYNRRNQIQIGAGIVIIDPKSSTEYCQTTLVYQKKKKEIEQ